MTLTLMEFAMKQWASTLSMVLRTGSSSASLLRVTRGRKLRVDTTLAETTMHHPTDGSLLADGVRVLSRLLRGAKAAGGEALGLGARVEGVAQKAPRGSGCG